MYVTVCAFENTVFVNGQSSPSITVFTHFQLFYYFIFGVCLAFEQARHLGRNAPPARVVNRGRLGSLQCDSQMESLLAD